MIAGGSWLTSKTGAAGTPIFMARIASVQCSR
jgi:hypothetical protein